MKIRHCIINVLAVLLIGELGTPTFAGQAGSGVRGTAVSDCSVGLPGVAPGAVTSLATDLSGRLCLAGTASSNTVIVAAPLPAFASPPSVKQSGAWFVGGEGIAIGSVTTGTAAYAQNAAVGGVIALPVFRTAGGSGVLAKITILLASNLNPPLVIYLFEAAPTSLLVDGQTPAFSSSDWGSLIDAYSITPFAPQGASMTVGSIDLSTPVRNRDATPTTNLYAVIIAGASATFPTGSLRVSARLSQD